MSGDLQSNSFFIDFESAPPGSVRNVSPASASSTRQDLLMIVDVAVSMAGKMQKDPSISQND